MKAIERNTGNTVYVLGVYDDKGNVLRYVSDEKSYHPNELQIIESLMTD